MKIFQTQSRGSIGCFLKKLFAVLFFSFLLYATAVIIHISYFSYNPKVYQSSEEIIDLFNDNVSDFDEMIEILKETDVLVKLHTRYLTQEKITYPTGDSMSDPEVQLKRSGFVTDSQLDQIVAFFEKYNVDSLNDSYFFATIYSFSFCSKTHSVMIYYVDSEDELAIARGLDYWRNLFGGDIFHLEGNWYCHLSEND